MTPEERAVVDAAIAWYEERDRVLSREEWLLVQAVEALPDAHVTPLYG